MDKTSWEIQSKLKTQNSKFKVEDLVDVLLDNRGIKTKKAKEEFLNPKHPEEIKPKDVGIDEEEVKKAVGRVKTAIANDEQIVVYGDYDADGICATAIMWEALYMLGAKATPFIPDRFEDGYGINKTQISRLCQVYGGQAKLKLIITVDNGVVAHEALSEAKRLGIDVIVTDHHTYKKKPQCFATVHTTETSGSGVAYLFAQELTRKINFLELAAIGTIADQLPLVGFNRSVAKFGIEALNKTTRVGLRKLFAVAGLLGKKIGTYEINFAIAPRINASGRIANGMDALRLLCTTSPTRAEELATKLNTLNVERQGKVEEALSIVESGLIKQIDSVVVVSHEEFHEGVIGLIASKIVEKYYRPAIVLSLKGSISKASARSIAGFNIIEAIRMTDELILEGGGHEMAAGFLIKTEKVEEFENRINKIARPLLSNELLKRKIRIDCELQFDQLNRQLYDAICDFEPFGVGNPSPLFCAMGLEVRRAKRIGATGKHYKLEFVSHSRKIAGLLFNYERELPIGVYDIAYKLSLNEWNGRESVELIVKDIRKHERAKVRTAN